MRLFGVKAGLAISAVAICGFSSAQAATINIVRDNTQSLESVHGLRTDTGTLGADIDGAVVTAYYGDGTSEVVTWAADPSVWTNPDGSTYGSSEGAADGTDIDIFMSWDGFEMTTTRLLTGLTIDLAPANAVFDTTYEFDHDGNSTLGSGFGFAFELYSEFSAIQGAISATYTNVVNLAGAAPVGDLYATMSVDFSSLLYGGVLGDLSFRSDIDVMRYEDDLVAPVPLPASLSFLLLGLGGLGISRLGRKRG